MKIMLVLVVAVMAIFVFSTAAFGQEVKPTVESLSWISGCWEQNDAVKKRFGSEQWMKPSGGSMIGMSRTVRNGKTVAFEFLRIMQDDTGINYISKPSQNKEETAFKLIKSSPNEVTFENPAHDFPQRIIYRLDGGNLFARIEGNNNGKAMGIDFPMTKVNCEERPRK